MHMLLLFSHKAFMLSLYYFHVHFSRAYIIVPLCGLSYVIIKRIYVCMNMYVWSTFCELVMILVSISKLGLTSPKSNRVALVLNLTLV